MHSAPHRSAHWVSTWVAVQLPALGEPVEYGDQTLRLIVRTSIGGDQVRLRISNAFGTSELRVGGLHIARRSAGPAIEAGSDRILTHEGEPSFIVPAGASVLTDPVELEVDALAHLAVSLYLPVPTKAETHHFFALQTSYVSASRGDLGGAPDLPDATPITTWPWLCGVDVETSSPSRAIVALGDSITDGASSTLDANRRWPDLLAERLNGGPGSSNTAVLNQGIIGNRLLSSAPEGRAFHGAAGIQRCDSDVFAFAGVSHVIVQFGINDIGFPASVTPASEAVDARSLSDGFARLVELAHGCGVRVIGTTITPFQGAVSAEGFYSSEKEAIRRAVNEWIRASGVFDGVVDFELALRDPEQPTHLRSTFDSGDHMHPNDAGHQALADVFDLRLLGNVSELFD
jgi:lysophospholipase L1-like esterase